MTSEEALLYLSIGELDPEEAYEVRVFEMRQFFLKQVPVSRLYRTKIQRMLLEQEAFEALGVKSFTADFELPVLMQANSSSLLDLVRSYQRNSSHIKSALVRASSLAQLMDLSKSLLENMRNYGEGMACSDENGVQPKLTQAVDEMDVLAEVQRLAKEAMDRIECISQLDSDNPVRKEANRLSLWLKMEMDDRAV